jgi:hypothetical protein
MASSFGTLSTFRRALSNRSDSVVPLTCGGGSGFIGPIILPFVYYVRLMPITGGPYLTAAFFCDKVLREADGVLSAIRIVDRWNVSGPTELMQPSLLQGTLVVLLKNGAYRGQAAITITPISPSNERMQQIALPVMFDDLDEKGAGIVIPMAFPAQESGLYWFEIVLSGQAIAPHTISAIPMRVAYRQAFGPMFGPPNQMGQP